MAVTKIIPIKATVKKALDYICDPKKTDEKILISSYGCSPETADIEFGFTLSKSIKKGNNLAHHLIQAFDPGEVGYDQAHEIGKQLADEVLKGKYEYVITTHIDKGHIHNHIIFCAADMEKHRKYESNKKSYFNIRRISDKLCRDNGLSVIAPSENKGKNYKAHLEERGGASWKEKLQFAIDNCIAVSSNFDEFINHMKTAGYEVKQGKHISFRANEQERFTRAKTVGADYTEERILQRIANKKDKVITVPAMPIIPPVTTIKRIKKPSVVPDKKINLIIDIQNNIKAQESRGYTQWAKINNLKQMSKTLNFLKQNNIASYDELKSKESEVVGAFNETNETLKHLEKRLSDMTILMKHLRNYYQTKPIHDGYNKAILKDKFKRQNESALIMYEATKKALDALLPDKKLPDYKTLKSEHDKLTVEKNALYQEYYSLKEKAKEYGIIKSNVDNFLAVPTNERQAPQKQKNHTEEI